MTAATRRLFDDAQAISQSRPEEAIALIEQARAGLERVPVSYDILAAKVHLAAGRPAAALSLLQPRMETDADNAHLHKVFAAALRGSGRRREADAHLLLAARRVRPRIAAPHAADGETAIPALSAADLLRETVVFDPGHKAMLVFIPKVACTALKATVVMNSPFRDDYERSGLTIHRFVAGIRPRDELPELMASPDIFRWTVVREPLKRVLSAYLNKIVGAGPNTNAKPYKLKTIEDAQRLAGLPYDPQRSITFQEFVRHLMTVEDADMNVHWMPQSRIVGSDLSRYAHVGQMEQLDVTFEHLRVRLGYRAERDSIRHLGGTAHHATGYNEASTLSRPNQRLPRRLRQEKAGFPPPGAFYDAELSALVQERYADDVVLHQKAGTALRT